MAVRASRAVFTDVGVHKVGGCVTVGFEGTQHFVVDLPKEDLAPVRAQWVITRQMDASYHPRLVAASAICHLSEKL